MKANGDNFIHLLRQRKEEGILYVIENYGGLIRSVIWKRLSHFPDRAEECMNDVLFGIWQNIDRFDEAKGSFVNWAAGVARLESIDMLRKIQREKSTCSIAGIDDAECINGMGIMQEDQALSELLDHELSKETEELLYCLSEKDRELFRRIFMEQEKPEEVARSLGMSADNVYVRLFRGKRKIRKKAAQWKGVRIV